MLVFFTVLIIINDLMFRMASRELRVKARNTLRVRGLNMDIKNIVLLISLLCFLGGANFAQDLPENSDQPQDLVPEASADSAEDSGEHDPSKEAVSIYSSPIEGEPSFRLSETDNSLLFFQRLKWEEAEYAVSYHVILERKRDNMDTYTEVLRKNVTEPYLDISVPAGEYRYQVLSFNILGLLDSQSDWEYFIVLQALKPSIVAFSPLVFYLDRLTPRILNLMGENLLPEAEIYLVSKTLVDEAGEPLILRPQEIHRNELGENARLVFDEEDLAVGEYEIVVKNPGGLETRAGDFAIAVAKPFDINVSGGYAPMLTLFGQTEYFLDHVFVPLSFFVRGSFVPFKWDIGNLGFELGTGWSYLTSEQNEKKTQAHLVLVNADVLYQYWIIKRELSVNGRAGIGFAGIFNYRFEYTNTGKTGDSISTAAFSFNLGASVQWLLYKQVFVEGGLDYIHIAHPEIPMGFVRIGVFGGYQF